MKSLDGFSRITVLAAALACGLAALAPAPARACTSDGTQFIGATCFPAFDWCPKDYLPANGQTLDISGNQALYSLIGCSFGGDCETTFNLPDLRGRAIVHQGEGPGLPKALYATSPGMETITPSVETMAIHNHIGLFTTAGRSVDVKVSTTYGLTSTPSDGNYLAGAYNDSTRYAFPNWKNHPSATVPIGGVAFDGGSGDVTVANEGLGGSDTPIAVINPRLVLTACIAVDGSYPSRPN